MPQPSDRVVLDISFNDFDYAINSCLERCHTLADCERLTSEILRIMKIKQRREQNHRARVKSVAHARIWRWL